MQTNTKAKNPSPMACQLNVNRMQAASKAATLGAALVLAGGAMGLGDPPAIVRTVVAVVFLALTMPVAAHLLGRAAARTGVPFSDETKSIELPDRD